ncbi:MAG: rRNA adenine N-6-methyltransferase family protein, partial [Burkholderiaceae bacterium]
MRMAQWALQFTPDVCLGQWPDVILLEVAPSLRLWGGCSRLLQALALEGHEKVLEVGTGSGFITACLARLARQVTSIDIHGAIVAG